MIETLKYWIEAIQNYKQTKKELVKLNKVVKNSQTGYEAEIMRLYDKVDGLEKELSASKRLIHELRSKNVVDLKKHKSYYMYPAEQREWLYNTKRRGREDVRNVLRRGDMEVVRRFTRDLLQKGGLSEQNKPSQIVSKVYQLFIDEYRFSYVSDQRNHRRIEYWQEPEVTIETGKGDCDDLSILMYFVLVEALKIYGCEDAVWRLRFCATKTVGEGHALNLWLHEDGEWYAVESTLNQRDSYEKTWLKTPVRNNNLYVSWYGFSTRKKSWRGDTDAVEPWEDYA